MIDLKEEPFIKAIQEHKGQVYFVGGYVRDHVMQIEPDDLDLLVTGLSMRKLVMTLSIFGNTDLVGESFGVIKFKPFICTNPELESHSIIDIAIPRKEIKTGEGHRGFEVVASPDVTLEEDLNRRDFTINSMAMTLDGEVIDFHMGMDDIKERILQYTNKEAFLEDPLRLIRAVRFSARFHFVMHSALQFAIQDNIPSLFGLPSERILEEFKKMYNKSRGTSDLNDFNYMLSELRIKSFIFNMRLGDIAKPHWNISHYSEFIFTITNWRSDSPELYNSLKGDNKTYKELQSLVALQEASEAKDKYCRLLHIVNSYKYSDIADSTTLFKIDELGLFIDRKLPRSRKDLAMDGNDMLAELKADGKEFPPMLLGDVIDKVLRAVLFGNIDNNYYDIKWFLTTIKYKNEFDIDLDML